MASMDWWRSWHGAPTDSKWLLIGKRAGVAPGVVSAIAWALFDYASQDNDRGSVEGFDVETYSVFSGFDEAEIQSVIDAMTDKGIITEGRLSAWEKRQPKKEDPTSGERVRRFRDNKRNEEVTLVSRVTSGDVTHSNAMKRDVTHSNAVKQDVTIEKSREEKKREEENAHPPGFDAVELNFRLNLITAVQERDPGQRFQSGFSLSKSSSAALLQVMNSGPVLSAKSIDWALDQWENAKPQERFDASKPSCVNWLLATILNGYKPGHVTVNGKTPAPDPTAEMTARAKRNTAVTTQAIAALKAEGVTEDDPMFYNLLTQRTEALHAA